MRSTRLTQLLLLTVAGLLFVTLTSAAGASHLTGTPRADRLVGSQRGDRLDGRAGNDTLLGLGGRDVLIGGPGNDKLDGGLGRDTLQCGPGKDVALADRLDAISSSCEVVRGLVKPAMSIRDASAVEGNSGTSALAFAVTLSAATPVLASAKFTTVAGTATAPSDYATASGTLLFKPGETSKQIAVPVVGDGTFEADEAFTVVLSSPVNATLLRASATGTITNDDQPPARAGFYSGNISSSDFPGQEFINFSVLADGQSVASFTFVFIADCAPEGTYQFAPVSVPGAVVPIGTDRTFSLEARGEGTNSISVSGRFDNSGAAASGSFRAHAGFTDSGSHFECDTGERTWSAVWKGPLPPLSN